MDIYNDDYIVAEGEKTACSRSRSTRNAPSAASSVRRFALR
jgi:hypothetical protein